MELVTEVKSVAVVVNRYANDNICNFEHGMLSFG